MEWNVNRENVNGGKAGIGEEKGNKEEWKKLERKKEWTKRGEMKWKVNGWVEGKEHGV